MAGLWRDFGGTLAGLWRDGSQDIRLSSYSYVLKFTLDYMILLFLVTMTCDMKPYSDLQRNAREECAYSQTRDKCVHANSVKDIHMDSRYESVH